MEESETTQPDLPQRGKDRSAMRKAMLDRLAHSDAHFKHQARGEPDLGIEEKYAIAAELLDKNSGLFLERFFNNLTLEDIDCFSEIKDDYIVSFYLDKIREKQGDRNKLVVKNRRYQALQEMMDEGDYFSETEMQKRDPLLFDQLVGQYESEEEKQARDIDKTDVRFSSILLKHMDLQDMKSRYDRMKEWEEGQEEEEEESDEDEEKEEEEKSNDIKAEDESNTVSEAERVEMRHEFLRIMQERFLSGEDSQFEYSNVDSNAVYDSLDILNQDAEEKYFDGEDSMEADPT